MKFVNVKNVIFANLFVCLILLQGCTENIPIENKKTTFIVGNNSSADFQGIQDAINHSSTSDTILVLDGVYNETIIINRQITLKAKNEEKSIISYNGEEHNKNIITITADNCSLIGFTITNAGNGTNTQGIKISSNYNLIQKNKIKYTRHGITLNPNSNKNNISYNNFTGNYNGIFVFSAHENMISNNTFSNNSGSGIHGKESTKNNIFNNFFTENKYGIYFCCGSKNNYAFENVFIANNELNVKGSYGNIWDINGKGNFWDDYSGSDLNGDSIGDTPYEIEGGVAQDHFPMMTAMI